MPRRSATVLTVLAMTATAAHGQADLLLREAIHLSEVCPDLDLNVRRLEEITAALSKPPSAQLSDSGDAMVAVISPSPDMPPPEEESSEDGFQPAPPPAAPDPCARWSEMFGPDGWAFRDLLVERR